MRGSNAHVISTRLVKSSYLDPSLAVAICVAASVCRVRKLIGIAVLVVLACESTSFIWGLQRLRGERSTSSASAHQDILVHVCIALGADPDGLPSAALSSQTSSDSSAAFQQATAHAERI